MLHQFPDAHPADGGIADVVLADEGVLRTIIRVPACSPFPEDRIENHHAEHHSHHSHRIAHCTGKCHIVRTGSVPRFHLKECLLTGSQHWSVGDRTAKEAHHIRQRYPRQGYQQQGHRRTRDKDARGENVKLDSSLFE